MPGEIVNVDEDNMISQTSQGFLISEVDVEQIMKLYERLMKSVKDDLLVEYKNTRISGPTYADMLAELQKAAMTGAMSSVVSFMSKETDADRCVKRAQCDKIAEEIKKIREDITSSTAKTKRDDTLGASQVKKADAEVLLVQSKEKAEKIKNGDSADKGSAGPSLYGYNKAVLDAQDKLYQRQKAGFNDNARQKLYDSSVSTYGIIFQDASLTKVAPPFSDASLQSLFTSVQSKIGQ